MEFSDFDRRNLELLEALPNRQSKHCFRSAINHLKRATTLFPIDSSMAVFRCITSEEEAATGLMYCLKDRGYSNSEKLLPWDHKHKHAFIPFFSILCQFVEDHFREYGIELNLTHIENNGQIQLGFEVTMETNGQENRFIPEPPLNFRLLHQEKRFSYIKQITKLLEKQNVRGINEHIKANANQRNSLLYATPYGFPSEIQVDAKFFPAYKSRVMAMLRTYLLIEPYMELQPFVQDSLDAFLAMIDATDVAELNLNGEL